jgi:DNA polymerase-1
MGMKRSEAYITNISKWALNDKKEIKPEEMEMLTTLLEEEICKVQPDVILALGAVATHWFIGDLDMEAVSGVPHRWDRRNVSAIVVPCFHPAATFRDSSLLQWVIEGFRATKKVLDGENWDVWEEGSPTHDEGILFQLCQDVVALDTEAQCKGGPPYIVSASSCETMAGYCYVDDEKSIRHIADHVAQPHVLTLLHNALYDLPQLAKSGIHPARWIDTMVVAFLLQTLPLGLKPLAYRLTGMRMKEYDEVVGERSGLPDVPEAERIAYAIADADATLRVYNRMKSLWYARMEEVIQRDMEVMPMIGAMMEAGILADVNFFDDLNTEFSIRNMNLREKIDGIARGAGWEPKPKAKDPTFNPASAPQVAELLYERLRLGRHARIKKTKWGGSTNTQSIKKIENDHPVVKMIEEWRQTDTLEDKFLGVLPKKVEGDGRIHTKISMVRVKHSGRLASSDPNLMAQPIRTEDGMRIRNGFIASPGFTLASFDYNQVEMRLMAHLSQDPVMMEVYREGGDIHTDTAMRSFGIKNPKDVDEMKHRYPAKRTGFGIINLITAHGLARELVAGGAGVWTEEKCQELLDAWFDIHPGVSTYFQRVISTAGRDGKVVDMWGREEYIPEMKSYFPHVRETGERKAVNQSIQSGAQGIIKEAMRRLWPQIVEWNKRWDDQKGGDAVRPLIQVHDSLLFEIRDSIMDSVMPQIKELMEGVVKLSIPITVKGETGRRWGELKKYKEV